MRAKHFSTPSTPETWLSHLANRAHHALVGHGVHQLQAGIARHAKPGENDDQAHGESAIVVGREEPLWIVERETHGGERGQAGDDIDRVVPGVRRQSGAADLLPKAIFHAAMTLLMPMEAMSGQMA